MSRLEAEVERAEHEQAISPGLSGIASAAVGLAALIVAHAISGLTNVELMVFFGLDVLLPLAVLTANPKAPITAYGLAIVVYVALLTEYVAI